MENTKTIKNNIEEEVNMIDEKSFPFFGDYNSNNNVKYKNYTSYMTVYEKARLIGARAEKISLGSPPFVKTLGCVDPIEIAKEELRKKVLPAVVKRTLPNGISEDRLIESLIGREKWR